MASGKSTGVARQDEENLLAAWHWTQQTMKDTGYIIGCSILPTKRQGVWKVQARAMHAVDGKAVGVAVQVQAEYPTASYRSFTAALMNCLMQLDYELGQDALQRGKIA